MPQASAPHCLSAGVLPPPALSLGLWTVGSAPQGLLPTLLGVAQQGWVGTGAQGTEDWLPSSPAATCAGVWSQLRSIHAQHPGWSGA